jgi:hypothetical protein
MKNLKFIRPTKFIDMGWWLAISVLLFITSSVNSIKLTCDFEIHDNLYTCFPQKSFQVTEKSDRTITEVDGKHLEGKSLADVVKFQSKGNVIKYFPEKLATFLPKLENIDISSAKLQEVKREDFQPFGSRLKAIKLTHNEITSLEPGLFQHNINLETINLSDNQIKYVGEGALASMKFHLISISFYNNHCYNDGAYYPKVTKFKVVNILMDIERRCSRTAEHIQADEGSEEGDSGSDSGSDSGEDYDIMGGLFGAFNMFSSIKQSIDMVGNVLG